jgi:hypothetical protein
MRDLERRRRKREAHLASLTPEQREAYMKRSKAMRPGAPAERAQRKHDRDVRNMLQRNAGAAASVSAEVARLDARIAELEAEIAASRQGVANDQEQ